MLDASVAIVVVLFAVLGLMSGLLLQVLRLVAAAVASYVALCWSGPAMDAIPGLLAGSPELRRALFPIGLFLATYIVLSLIAKLISAGVHGASTSLTLVDRTLGAVAGALKGLVLCWFLVAVLLATEAASGNEFPRLDTRGSRAAALVRKYRIPGVPSDLKALEESVLPAGVRRAVGVGGGQGD